MMGSRILSNMSHQANYLGQFSQVVQLARPPRKAPGAPPPRPRCR
jgi:hypothetical protein